MFTSFVGHKSQDECLEFGVQLEKNESSLWIFVELHGVDQSFVEFHRSRFETFGESFDEVRFYD